MDTVHKTEDNSFFYNGNIDPDYNCLNSYSANSSCYRLQQGEACAHLLAAAVFTGSVFECRKPHRCIIDMGSVVRPSG